ncbi:hypothetical protein C8R46DRAFT_1305151 [Mycena filopes]|nr:hypothetical protein C8R46DRAFT_1305151 [Mycena filopes]
MSTTALTIAILGATGDLGSHILRAIAAHPKAQQVRLRILTRAGSAEKAHALAGQFSTLYLTVHEIDYSSATARDEGLGAALHGVDVVLSAVGDDSGEAIRKDVRHTGQLPGFMAQDAVARVAKEAGVRLFVPSEYGWPSHTLAVDSESFVVGKRLHHELLRELGLPYLLVYAGSFPEIEPPATPLQPLTVDAPIPLGTPPFETTRNHVALYLTELLLDRGVDAVAGGIYVIRGQRRDRGIVSAETGKTAWVVDA